MAFHPEQEASCTDCGSTHATLDPARAEVVCECGLVLQDRIIDPSQPLRTNDDGVILSGHVGPPQTPGLGAISGSVISYGNRDASGTPLSSDPVARARLFRMRTVQRDSTSLAQRGGAA